MEELSSRKRVRDELEDTRFDYSPEVKRIKEDLLENFDDADFFTASHELDSFMKSFEEEISSEKSTEAAAVAVVDLTSESGDSQPDLGFLLGASDDELGIPPSSRSDVEKDELVRVVSDSSELSELWRYDDGIGMPNFDSYEFGIGDAGSYYNTTNIGDGGDDGGVAFDGLFDYSDMGYGSSDYLWRPETLPAN